MASEKSCLRCESVKLIEQPDSTRRTRFWLCPRCHRQFAQSPGKSLTERWGGPLSLVLYNALFTPRPQTLADSVAASLLDQNSREKVAWIEREIRLELASPKQNVRDILDLRSSEQDLREFLALVADRLHQLLV